MLLDAIPVFIGVFAAMLCRDVIRAWANDRTDMFGWYHNPRRDRLRRRARRLLG